ncbi:hypothetical protein IE53DRAFT_315278 [Violaceomyces palustris]|uniref:Uncharacterized protein n=1 Tax=Violaceomyces palustris TaxID=1673888 RepID=A0ACD0NY46_9BASI|nr:hypothetical protein IE53DRAFT_315278 [Violaceomyces palustris]
MRAVLQRVKGATVHVDGKVVSRIGPGIVALIGISTDDTLNEIVPLANKVLNTKLWNERQEAKDIKVPSQYQDQEDDKVTSNGDASGQPSPATPDANEATSATRAEEVWGGKPWKRSVMELGGEVLCVSQFTLHARTTKGTKPDFHRAMGGDTAKEIYDSFLKRLGDSYRHDRIKDGQFGAMMDVSLTNDGESTIQWGCCLAEPGKG